MKNILMTFAGCIFLVLNIEASNDFDYNKEKTDQIFVKLERLEHWHKVYPEKLLEDFLQMDEFKNTKFASNHQSALEDSQKYDIGSMIFGFMLVVGSCVLISGILFLIAWNSFWSNLGKGCL